MKCPRCNEDDSTGPTCACGYQPPTKKKVTKRKGRYITIHVLGDNGFESRRIWMPGAGSRRRGR